MNIRGDARDFALEAFDSFLKISFQLGDAPFLAVYPFTPQRTPLRFELRQFFAGLTFDFFHLVAAAVKIRNQIAGLARFRRKAGLRILKDRVRETKKKGEYNIY